MKIEEIKAKYAILNDAATDKKKRYEVHFQAQDAKGNIFNLVKEAVCKPGELKSILKKFEAEQKAKGNKIISELYRKSFAVDSVSVNDAISIRRVANADPEDSHITVKFKDGKLHDYSFKSVKAAMDYIMQGNYKGAVVVGFPSRKVLAK
ncbi:MAG: hypothetical protein MJY89_06280 [Bacteroidales bacterium]|nr:hypothetical protein [Bacteroidales bacterium]